MIKGRNVEPLDADKGFTDDFELSFHSSLGHVIFGVVGVREGGSVLFDASGGTEYVNRYFLTSGCIDAPSCALDFLPEVRIPYESFRYQVYISTEYLFQAFL